MPALEAEPFITTIPQGAQSEDVERVPSAQLELLNNED
jgi:hypothetical protein